MRASPTHRRPRRWLVDHGAPLPGTPSLNLGRRPSRKVVGSLPLPRQTQLPLVRLACCPHMRRTCRRPQVSTPFSPLPYETEFCLMRNLVLRVRLCSRPPLYPTEGWYEAGLHRRAPRLAVAALACLLLRAIYSLVAGIRMRHLRWGRRARRLRPACSWTTRRSCRACGKFDSALPVVYLTRVRTTLIRMTTRMPSQRARPAAGVVRL